MSAVEQLYERAFRYMDSSTGMFPEGWTCVRCGRELNADGWHPAELYAGTFNGLCYPCTGEKAYVVEVEEDGCQVWSYPPHCPSWRRDRETYRGYSECEVCCGTGLQGDHGWHGRRYCVPCFKRRFPPPPPVPPLPEWKSRGEWEREAYVEVVGRVLNLSPGDPGYEQWTYKPPIRRADRDALVLSLTATSSTLLSAPRS